MMKINLLGAAPPPTRRKREGPPPTTTRMALVFIGTLIIAFVLVGLAWQILTRDLAEKQKQLDAARAEQARLAAIQAENQRYLAEIRDLETRKNTTQMLLNSRIGPVELMTALGNTVNRTTDLYLLTVIPTGPRLTIRGQSNTVESIARFIAALKESGSFDDVQLQRWYQDDQFNRLSFKFDLDCVFKSRAAAAPAPGAQPAAPSKPARRPGM